MAKETFEIGFSVEAKRKKVKTIKQSGTGLKSQAYNRSHRRRRRLNCD